MHVFFKHNMIFMSWLLRLLSPISVTVKCLNIENYDTDTYALKCEYLMNENVFYNFKIEK